jgi:MarR family transcriptional regulator, organic hydroperoxide resistance regulator
MSSRMRKQPEHDGLALDEFLCFAIYSAGHAFNQFYRPLLDELGLTYPQYLAMVTLWSKDDRTVKEVGQALFLESNTLTQEVGQALFLESNTLTPLLKRLETLGLISRTRDPLDERQVRVRLTEEGRALRARAAAVPTCIADAVGLPKARVQALLDEISEIRDRLVACEGASESD